LSSYLHKYGIIDFNEELSRELLTLVSIGNEYFGSQEKVMNLKNILRVIRNHEHIHKKVEEISIIQGIVSELIQEFASFFGTSTHIMTKLFEEVLPSRYWVE
jgi:hypothetical protein